MSKEYNKISNNDQTLYKESIAEDLLDLLICNYNILLLT